MRALKRARTRQGDEGEGRQVLCARTQTGRSLSTSLSPASAHALTLNRFSINARVASSCLLSPLALSLFRRACFPIASSAAPAFPSAFVSTTVRLPACLPTYLPACLPAYLPPCPPCLLYTSDAADDTPCVDL
eukprot:6204565-Pleurochrysis_carterae.AAC.1